MNKKLNTLGLCRRAGKLITGFDPVVEEMAKPSGKVAGVMLASDISPKTRKEILFQADKYGVKTAETDSPMDEIGKILGKRTGIIAVLDEGLFRSLSE